MIDVLERQFCCSVMEKKISRRRKKQAIAHLHHVVIPCSGDNDDLYDWANIA